MRSPLFVVPALVTLGDLGALVAAWWVTWLAFPPGFPVLWLVLLAVVHQLVLSSRSLHAQLRYVGSFDLLRRIAVAWARVAAAVCVIACVAPASMPAPAAITFGLAFLVTLVAVRLGSMLVRRHLRQHGRNIRHVVIAGGGPAALLARQRCTSDRGLGLRVVGHLVRGDAAAEERSVDPGDVLGTYDDLERVVRDHVVDELVFADPQASFATMAGLIDTARGLGTRTHVSTEFLGAWQGVDVQHWHGDVVLRLTPYPHDVFGMSLKRVFDIVVAGIALLCALPLFAVIAVLIKLDSRGPVFFGQWRIGLNGRRFWFPKFRSMRDGAEAGLAALAAHNEMDGPVFKMRNDPRVTRVGRFLRRFSLDETPQLWCVLRGEMSLVGPRPLMPHEIAGHTAWQRRRLSVPPGLTCLWQISGRNNVDFERWMRLDLEYIDTWSLWLDLRILARTVPAVLSRRGAC